MQTVLFIGTVWPEPTSSAAGVRFLQIVDAFAGFRRVFASPAKVNAFEAKLREMGLQTAHFLPNDSAFDAWIKTVAPDVVVFERFIIEEQFGWRVREQCPQAVRVLDMQDFHSLRKFREAELARSGKWGSAIVPPAGEDMPDDVRREIASILRSDLTLVISDFERDLLVQKFGVPEALLRLHRFAFPKRSSTTFGRGARHGFLFIGNFRHTPNLDAVKWLVRDLWPKIRAALPVNSGDSNPELLIAGAYPPADIMALSNPGAGVKVLGPVPDQYELMARVRVSVAPLRTGAGIKGKIAESWWMGTPVVTTTIGAEGMTDGRNFAGAIADDSEMFAKSCAELYANDPVWEESAARAPKIVEALYSAEDLNSKLMGKLAEVTENLPIWRAQHPLGQVLWSQGLRATEYFSRWIEAKNRP